MRNLRHHTNRNVGIYAGILVWLRQSVEGRDCSVEAIIFVGTILEDIYLAIEGKVGIK
jgi:hypothetical protein